MLIKSTIYEILKKYFDEYLYGFEKDQLDVALLSGQIELVNVNFKPSKVNELLLSYGQPFYMKSGMIGKLKIKYNYRNWLSNPVEISINELLIIFSPILLSSSDPANQRLEAFLTENSEESSHHNSEDFYEKMQQPTEEKNSNKILGTEGRTTPVYSDNKQDLLRKEEGIIEKYLSKILVNLTLTVDTVHIRYEDETYPYKHPFALSVIFDSLNMKTAGTEWYLDDRAEVKKRGIRKNSTVKEGKIKALGVYLTSMAGMLIPYSLWEATINSEIGIFEGIAAYELRDLLLQETENLRNNENSTLLYPLNADFSITISQEKPLLKVSGICDKLLLKLSSSMSECLRNFNEYYVNAGIWWKIKKYRPCESIISEPRTEFESKALRDNRSAIIKSWYLYAFRFIKTKMRLKTKKKEANDLNKEPETPLIDSNIVDQSLMQNHDAEDSPIKRPSLFTLKPRKPPGISTNSLSTVVKDYNSKLSESDFQVMKASAKPLIQEPNFFPKFLEHSDLDFKLKEIAIFLIDEETRLKSETKIEIIYMKNRISSDELNCFLSIDHIISTVQESFQSSKIVEIGKLLIINDKNQKNIKEYIEKAVEVLFIYKPNEKKILHRPFPLNNMYELLGKVSEINIEYSIQVLQRIFTVYETFKTDKISREYLDAEYMKKIEKKRTSLTVKEQFIKKQRQIIHGAVFKKLVLTKKMIKTFLEWKGNLKASFKEADHKIQPIMLNCKLETGGVNLKLLGDDELPSSIFFLPNGILEFIKEEKLTKFSAWGFGLQTNQPFKTFYKHLLEVSNITSQRRKRLRVLTKRG